MQDAWLGGSERGRAMKRSRLRNVIKPYLVQVALNPLNILLYVRRTFFFIYYVRYIRGIIFSGRVFESYLRRNYRRDIGEPF